MPLLSSDMCFQPMIRIYDIPNNTFESDEDDDDETESESSSEEDEEEEENESENITRHLK